MKNNLLIILLIFLTNCGYTPIYKNINSSDFSINIIDTSGNAEINNLIKNELELDDNQESKNKYDISIDTNFEKKVIFKDTSGATSDYQLFLEVAFTVTTKDKKDTFLFSEKLNVTNNSDSFNQKSYEEIIKRNFVSSIKEKLMLKLSNYK